MDNRISRPPELRGDDKDQILTIWKYLYSLSEKLNFILDGIGSNELTDRERAVIQNILDSTGNAEKDQHITMKKMIIALAQYVQDI